MSSRTRCKITSFHLHIYCPVGTYSLVFISFGTNHFFALSLRIFLFIIRSKHLLSYVNFPECHSGAPRLYTLHLIPYTLLLVCLVHGGRSPCILAFTLYTLHFPPKNHLNLAILFAQSKIIHYLCSRIYAGGDMSVVKSVSHGTFYRVGSDILIAFIDALCLMYET